MSLINFWSIVVGLFLVLWGYNYHRPDLKTKLELTITPADVNQKDQLFNQCISNIKKLPYLRLPLNSEVSNELSLSFLETQKSILESFGYQISGHSTVQRIYPKGLFRRLGISGIYIPFIGQGNVDASLTNLEYPFIASHELSHANGITDEGEASLVAYLTCMNSDNDFTMYSAQIYLIRNLLFHIQHEEPTLYKDWLKRIPPKVKSDMLRIRDNANKYPDVFPEVSNRVNDAYLKANGIESGSKSYGELINLIVAFESQN